MKKIYESPVAEITAFETPDAVLLNNSAVNDVDSSAGSSLTKILNLHS